jgi:hypothetical protein
MRIEIKTPTVLYVPRGIPRHTPLLIFSSTISATRQTQILEGHLAGHRPFTETIVFWKHTSEPMSTRETSRKQQSLKRVYTLKRRMG